jgi:hypothetical protein
MKAVLALFALTNIVNDGRSRQGWWAVSTTELGAMLTGF